ncbi:MAG TPA: hypothetical protein VMH80_23770 [Bryobacteraceae bacterium]|nr:hypothetical protein [Bryobacteraceae bacterium]
MKRTILTLAAAVLSAGVAVSQEGAVPAGTGNPYLRARQLPARIMEFKADHDSIQPGQTVTLTWATENPTSATIEPDIGRVTARGVREFTPAATTTYTLTVHGPNDEVLTRSVTVKVAGTVAVAESSGEAAKKEVPRTADGKPDLSGVYDFSFGRGRPGARGPGARGPAAAPDPNGPVLKPGAEKYKVVHGPDDAGQYADCMPLAGPQAFMVPYQFELVQSAHRLAILFGYPGTFRIIPTDGGLHPADPDPTWMGDSIGHWEGDTLVVDSVGFNDKTEINGFHHTESLHIVERFRRADYNTLDYEATIEDPNVFVKPWIVNRAFALRPDLTKVDEFVCEHNPDYSKYFEKK